MRLSTILAFVFGVIFGILQVSYSLTKANTLESALAACASNGGLKTLGVTETVLFRIDLAYCKDGTHVHVEGKK